ncbi:MAG: hypothetical protein WAP74_00545 [Patescibacteria group bacterium]
MKVVQTSEFEQAILTGRDRVVSAAASQAWQDIPETLRFCLALGQCWNLPNLKRHQIRLIERSCRKVGERFEQLSPETVIKIAKAYCSIVMNQAKPTRFALVFLTSERGQVDRAVRLFDLFHRARKSLWGEIDQQDNLKWYTSLHHMFGEVVYLAHRCATWQNLLIGAVQGHCQAVRVIEMLLLHYGTIATQLSIVPISQWQPGEALNSMAAFYMLAGNATEIVRLPVPDAVASQFSELVHSIHQQFERDEFKLNELIEWFDRHEQQYLDHEAQMWHEIIDEPRYGLRTGGADRVKLNVSALQMRQIKYTSLQLLPDQFPNARAKLWLTEFDQPVSISFTLNPRLNSVNPDLVFERDDPRYGQILIDRILYYIGLHSYWKIITGKLDAVMGIREVTQVRLVRQDGARAPLFRLFQQVRPHFRRLPEGYQASEEAVRLAAATIGLPPECYTFVREHERGYQEVENLPPLFTYHDRDIGYEPGSSTEQPTAL